MIFPGFRALWKKQQEESDIHAGGMDSHLQISEFREHQPVNLICAHARHL